MFGKAIRTRKWDINKFSESQYLQTDTISSYLKLVLPGLIKGLTGRNNPYMQATGQNKQAEKMSNATLHWNPLVWDFYYIILHTKVLKLPELQILNKIFDNKPFEDKVGIATDVLVLSCNRQQSG